MHTHVTVSLGETGYIYKNHIPDLELGDYVVVLLPSKRYTIGKVIDADPPEQARAKATKWVVDKVTFDTTKHEMLTALSPPVKERKQKSKPKLSAYEQALAGLAEYRKLKKQGQL